MAPATLQRKVACLRSFYRHLRRQGELETDPTANLRAPKQSRRLPHVLSRDEVGKLLEQPRGTEPAALRDRALLELMYACGLRASEAIDLETNDVDLEIGILRARGKGSKERIVPVGSAATRAVNAYLAKGRGRLVGDRLESSLFVNHRGAGLTRQGLYKIVQRHAATAGLAERMSPHTLRHTFATHLLGGRLRPAQPAGDARPRGHRHHPALHPPLRGSPQGRLLRRPPAGQDAITLRPVTKRAFVIVIDACGAGALPDAADYGDEGTNTLQHLAEAAGGLELPVLQALGLGNVLPLAGVTPSPYPVVHGRLHPLGPGKDTITGHWELMGVVTPQPLRTYPDGFPDDVLEQLRDATGRGVLCNQPYSGTGVIEDYGERHLATGDLIVYTSADSVLQIAAHVDEVPPAELYAACAAAREIMSGEHAVGRVIARPFRGTPGAFVRTDGRKDLALPPPGRSYMQELQAAGVSVHTVGKIGQVFDGVGVDHEHKGPTNAVAMAATAELIDTLEGGFVFTNLVETDQVYGHRNDVPGYHEALKAIDAEVETWLPRLDPERDLLIITADHGCDPTTPGTDHTREHVPLLARFGEQGGKRHDGPFADVGASVLKWLTDRDALLPGTPFV